MSIKKAKNYFDPRESLILNREDKDEDELTFEDARSLGAQRVKAERSGGKAATSSSASRSAVQTGTQATGMGLMTEMQKNNLSFDDARQLGMRNHALDYQRKIRERALKMREELKNQKSPYEELSKEDKGSLARLYSLQNQLKTFATYNQTNPQGGNPMLQTQNPYSSDIQQEYNKLYVDLNKKGYDVTKLMRYYERIKNGEAAESIKGYLAEKTSDHPALMSAASVGLNLATLQNSFPKAVKDTIYDKVYGTDLGVDTNAPELFGTYTTNAVRQKASEDIVEKTREKYGDGAAWAANLLYGTGMSMADSLTANALGGFTPIGGVIQGINAANSSLIDASERGVSVGKTLLTAAASGVFEGLFENVSLGSLKAMQPETTSTLKAVGKNILKQMGVEGSEEAATEIANIAFDSLVNGDKSSMALKRAAYVNQGMSKAEATSQVIWDAVKQVAEAGLGGALSGVGFGGSAALMNYAAYNGQLHQIGNEALQSGQYNARLRNALQFDPSSSIGKLAVQMANRDNVGNREVGRFVTKYDNAAVEAIEGAQNEQEAREAYARFAGSEEATDDTAYLAGTLNERLRELALQKADEERAQRDTDTAQNKASEIEKAAPADAQEKAARTSSMVNASNGYIGRDGTTQRTDTAAVEAGAESAPRTATGRYVRRDGTAWRTGEGTSLATGTAAEEADGRYSTMAHAKLANTGEEVTVMDVASTDGGVTVKLSDGRTAKLDELQFDSNEERTLYSMAKQFPTDKAKSFVNNYDGKVELETYTRAFNVLYDAGYKGNVSLEKAMQKFSDLPRSTRSHLQFLYLAGQNRAAVDAQTNKTNLLQKGTGSFANELSSGGELEESLKVLYEGVAAKTGQDVILRDKIQKDANGAFESALSRIVISDQADNKVATLIHETAEYVREYNPKGMLDLQEIMLSWYAKSCDFASLADMVEHYRDLYASNLGDESAQDAMGEMFNDALSALFTDEEGVKDLLNWLKTDSGKTVGQQKSFLQTVVDLFDRLIEKITGYFKEHSLPDGAKGFERMGLDQMKAIRQQFLEAIDQAKENYDAAMQQTSDGFAEVETAGKEKQEISVKMENGEGVKAERIDRSDAKYALNPDFEQQYDQWNKKDPRWRFKVGTTSEALKSIGIPDKKIIWDSGKIIKIKAKHSGMTDSVIKQVPHILESPVIIMRSKQSDSRITMFGEVYDRNEKPVLGVIELHPTRNGIAVDEFKVASAYGKDNAQRFINSSEILYVEPNKNRTHTWLRRTRLQLPVGLNQYGPIGRIARTGENVNSAASTDSSIRNGGQNDTSEGDIKYMFAGEKAKTANLASLERAKQEKESELQPSEMIRRSTGWHQGPDGKWRFEIDDSKARFGNTISHKLGEFLIHNELYETYPELREIRVEKLGEDEPKGLRGKYDTESNTIFYNSSLSEKERMKTLLHEIQHIIQRLEGLGKGGNRKLAERYLFNHAYDYAKTLPSYQAMQTPDQRKQFVKDLIAARSRSGDYKAALTEAYQNLFGEIEARNTANRQPLDHRGRKLASPANPKGSIVVTDWAAEMERYRKNEAEIKGTIDLSEEGLYNQNNDSDQTIEEGVTNDQTREARGMEEAELEGNLRGLYGRRINGGSLSPVRPGRGGNVSVGSGDSSESTSGGRGIYPSHPRFQLNQGGEMHDEERDTGSTTGVRGNKPAIRRGNRTTQNIRRVDGIREGILRVGEGIAGEPESRRGGIRGEEQWNEASPRGDESLGRLGLDQPRLQLKAPDEGTPEYAEMLSKWGAIKPGHNPFRHIEVPKKTSKTKKVRQFVRTVLESNAISDDMVTDIQESVVKEAMSYTPISDKSAQETAKKILKSGMTKAWESWNSVVNGDKMPDKKDIALGEYLLRTAAENGDKAEVVRLTAEIAELGTRAGQNVQALSMLKKMTGIGQLVYVQRTVDTLNKELLRRFKGKTFSEVTINEALAENLANAKTPEEVDAAAMEIYKDIADQMPPTWIDKWNAWRYLSMLGNPKTHIRNILGNAVFAPAVRLKDAIGAGIEAVAIKDGERTKAVAPKQEYKEFAKKDFAQMQDIIKSGGKMNPADVIRDQRTIFKNKTLERLRRKNSELMELEDGWFLKNHYQAALAQYLKANKVDLSEISEEQLNKARAYAVEQAQKATFRDASPVATAIQRASNANKVLSLIAEGVLPFKKTPINVLKRGVEYSPAGLLYALSRGSMQLKRGEITASQYIDGLASGLTGAGLTALGALLCSLGWVSGGFSDDKEDEFAKLQGRQEYALRIGDKTYTIDWMAPAAIPFFIGVELMAALKGEYDDVPSRAIIDALTNIAEPMFNLSMLDGLNNTINTVSFADNKLTAMMQEVMTSYFMQAIPSVSGQVARTADKTRRRTYIDKNSWVPESVQRAYQKLFNKIPGLSFLNQPYIDEWGREDTTQNIAVRAFENFLSPGWLSEIKTSDMEQELQRLYEATGENGVLPGYAAKFITVNGEKINLTGDEYTLFASTRGMTAYSIISEIVSSEEYANMSDGQKVKAIKDAFEFAGAAAKAAVSDYELDGWQQDANEENQEEGTSIGEIIAHRAATNGAAPEIASILQEEGAEAAQEKLDRMMKACGSRDEMKDQKGNVKSAITRAYKKKYIKYHDAGDTEGMRKIRKELMQLRTPVGKLYTMKDFRNWIN